MEINYISMKRIKNRFFLQTKLFALASAALLFLSCSACEPVKEIRIIYPQKVFASSSRLINPSSPYYSKALFDGKEHSPWISGNSLKHGREYILLEFPPNTYLQKVAFLNGFKKHSLLEKQQKKCQKWHRLHRNRNNSSYWRNKYQKAPFPAFCIHRRQNGAFSRAKSVRIMATTPEGRQHKYKFDINGGKNSTSNKKRQAPWVEQTLAQNEQALAVKKLLIEFRDFYYGHESSSLALGELRLWGFGEGHSAKGEHKRLFSWYDKNEERLIAREYLWDKRCSLVDQSKYVFAKSGEYSYITGLSYSTLGSEKGQYKLSPEGIQVNYRRYETTDKIRQKFDFTREKEKLMTIRYTAPEELTIQGRKCQIVRP